MGRKVLLVCDIVSSLLYIATVVLSPIMWEGYSIKYNCHTTLSIGGNVALAI